MSYSNCADCKIWIGQGYEEIVYEDTPLGGGVRGNLCLECWEIRGGVRTPRTTARRQDEGPPMRDTGTIKYRTTNERTAGPDRRAGSTLAEAHQKMNPMTPADNPVMTLTDEQERLALEAMGYEKRDNPADVLLDMLDAPEEIDGPVFDAVRAKLYSPTTIEMFDRITAAAQYPATWDGMCGDLS